MHESTKSATVDNHVHQLRRYKGELVRDLAYGTVRLPPAWLAPGDATIISLDAQAQLDADQASRCKVLLDQCVHLFDLIEVMISDFITKQRASGVRFAKNDLESLRRGRGPGRVRDLLFQQLPTWPESITDELGADVAAVLWKSLKDRQSHQTAAERDPNDLKALIQPLMAQVRRLVLEWTQLKRLRSAEADYIVSEVLDQLIRTVVERNQAPENLAAWSRSTARWKWLSSHGGRPDTDLGREIGRPGIDDVDDDVTRRVDLDRRLRAIVRLLRDRAQWYGTQTPPRPDDALICGAAAHLINTRQVEFLEMIVRGTPEGITAVRAELGRQAARTSPSRELAVIRLIRDTLRRHLEADA